MTLRILLFGPAREIAGRAEHALQLDEGATVAEAVRDLGRAYPAMEPLLPRCSFALDRVYVTGDERLGPESELAVIPPIGGG